MGILEVVRSFEESIDSSVSISNGASAKERRVSVEHAENGAVSVSAASYMESVLSKLSFRPRRVESDSIAALSHRIQSCHSSIGMSALKDLSKLFVSELIKALGVMSKDLSESWR